MKKTHSQLSATGRKVPQRLTGVSPGLLSRGHSNVSLSNIGTNMGMAKRPSTRAYMKAAEEMGRSQMNKNSLTMNTTNSLFKPVGCFNVSTFDRNTSLAADVGGARGRDHGSALMNLGANKGHSLVFPGGRNGPGAGGQEGLQTVINSFGRNQHGFGAGIRPSTSATPGVTMDLDHVKGLLSQITQSGAQNQNFGPHRDMQPSNSISAPDKMVKTDTLSGSPFTTPNNPFGVQELEVRDNFFNQPIVRTRSQIRQDMAGTKLTSLNVNYDISQLGMSQQQAQAAGKQFNQTAFIQQLSETVKQKGLMTMLNNKVSEATKLQNAIADDQKPWKVEFKTGAKAKPSAPAGTSFPQQNPKFSIDEPLADTDFARNISFTGPDAQKLFSEAVAKKENEEEMRSEILKKANLEAADKRLQYALEGRRQRKDTTQMKLLMDEFKLHTYKWDIEKCVEIGNKIGMDRQQVSKWNWDHRKKLGIDTSRRSGQLNKSRPPGWKKRETKADLKEGQPKRGRGRPRLNK